MIALTINVPRDLLLTANQRLNWREVARRKYGLRQLGGYTAVRDGHRDPFERQVHMTVHVAWPDRRRRDEHNLMPTLKPLIDGFVDADLLVDDSTAWLVGPDLRADERLCDKGWACSLTIEIEEER